MASVGLITLWNSPVDHELLKGSAFDLALYPLHAGPGAGSQQMLAEEGTNDKTATGTLAQQFIIRYVPGRMATTLCDPHSPHPFRRDYPAFFARVSLGALPKDTTRWRCSYCNSEFRQGLDRFS